MYHMSSGVCGVQKRALDLPDPLKLELQMVVNCVIWILGTKPRSSVRGVNAFNH